MYGRTDFDAETMLATYRRHNTKVQNYFWRRTAPSGIPNDDLLMMNMETDGWPELCAFLHLPMPSVPYPHEYVSRQRMFGQGSGI